MISTPKTRSTRRPSPQAATSPEGTDPPNAAAACMQQAMVAEAAFFLAEARGFAPGHELADWLEAERAVARQLGLEPD